VRTASRSGGVSARARRRGDGPAARSAASIAAATAAYAAPFAPPFAAASAAITVACAASLLALAFALALTAAGPALAADARPTDALDPERAWRVGALEIEGNDALSDTDVRRVVETRPRNRLTFWRKRPDFDAVIFERDRERVVRLYETEGYYKARVDWSLASKRTKSEEIVTLTLRIEEGPRAIVTAIEIDPPDPDLQPGSVGESDAASSPVALPGSDGSAGVGGAPATGGASARKIRRWALVVGAPFREADYQRLEAQLRAAYLERGHASVATKRSARVRPDREGVSVRYEITPGAPARFGPITLSGLERVASHLVQRELTFATGDPFSLARIEESRRRIQALDLFSAIEIDWTVDPADPGVAALSIALREKKPRELRIGGGYSTEERARAHIRWENRNWLGGGRRLILAGRYSNLVRSAAITFSQPHFFDRRNRGLFDFGLFQQDEPNFTRNAIQGVPAFERTLAPKLVGTLGLRVETDEIRDVEEMVRTRIGGVRDEGTVIGPRFNLRWTPVDDVAHPRDGFVASIDGQYSTRGLGATYDYFRLVGEVAVFEELFDFAVVAGRLKLGAAQAFGGKERLPIFERFYAGGEGSVRGYRRHQLGPTARNGNPLGGRSLIEGSVETRVPVWRQIGAVAFLDFAQVSLDRYDFVPDELRFSAGPGVSYSTPIGPISLFAGFPINRQQGEPPWQIHFNIGFFF